MAEEVTVPDFMEPIVGWRFWLVNGDNHLTGWGNPSIRGHVWPCYEPSVAVHRGYYPCNGQVLCHDRRNGVVASYNGCGHYALKSIDMLSSIVQDIICYSHAKRERLIIGQVNLWGTIVEHTKGYRAQFAYPKMFFGSIGLGETASAVAENYGVPLVEEPEWKLEYQSRQSELSLCSLQSQSGNLLVCQCETCQRRFRYVRNLSLSQLRGV